MFSGCPIVIVDKQTDCPYLNNVVCDNYDGGRQAARHLLGQGHRNIAFFTAAPLSETSSVRDRFAGFLHEMKAAGIAPGPGISLSPAARSFPMMPHFPQNAHRFSRSFLPCTATASPPSSPKTTGIAELIFLACRTIGLRIPGGSPASAASTIQMSAEASALPPFIRILPESDAKSDGFCLPPSKIPPPRRKKSFFR